MFDAPPTNLPVEPTPQPGGSLPTPPSPTPPPEKPPASPQPEEPATTPEKPATGGEPEDIFGDLDKAETEVAEAPEAVEESKQGFNFKPVIIAAVIVVLVAAVGAAVWFFVIQPKAAPVAPLPVVSEIPEEPATLVETPLVMIEENVPPAIVEPDLLPPEPITPEQPAETIAEVVQPVAAPDSDSDGLSDAEETLFGTSAMNADSDGDGYSDGSEVTNGYDPATSGQTLAGSSMFAVNDIGGTWSVLVPSAWRVSPDVESGVFKVDTGELTTFELTSEEVASGIDFNPPSSEVGPFRKFTNEAGYQVWMSNDGLTAYVLEGNSLLTARYMTNGAPTYDYPAIFEYLVQSVTKL
ncbi:hypothetical protein KKF59_00490 [Patescibacteria group bacterium]|nr:hypothetical protein [Patescibacteria group bacterium]